MKFSLRSILALLCLLHLIPAVSRPPLPQGRSEEAARRADRIIGQVATQRLDQWREGYFTGNDPGKYLPGAAMARLILDPQDADALRLMNDRRSPKEHYHFAAVNWARFLPLFGSILTEDTRSTFRKAAAEYTAYTNPGGTENHRVMGWSSAGVIPHFLETDRFGGMSKEQAMATAKDHLRRYVKGLYAAGQGEWDSSTYLMFDVNGLLNLYDFSPDPEVRLMADAGLKWLVASYALKYRDGMYCGPHFRGFTTGPVSSIADKTGWMWWGSSYTPTDKELERSFYALHAITSEWSPGPVLDAIARKSLPGLPVFSTASKPNYWHGLRLEPRAGAMHETLWTAARHSLGALWDHYGGQVTRWELVAETENGPVHFWGGHPRKSDHTRKKTGVGVMDGIGYYDQLAHYRSTFFHFTNAPEEEPMDWSFLAFPRGSHQGTEAGWWLFQAGRTAVAVYPFAQSVKINPSIEGVTLPHEHRKIPDQEVLVLGGRRNAFVLESRDLEPGEILQDFADTLSQPEWDDEEHRIRLLSPEGVSLSARMQPDGPSASLLVDGTPFVLPDQPLIDNPFVLAEKGVLRISDGSTSLTIDFTGDLPVFTSP